MEYFERKSLFELGYTESLDKLDVYRSEAFQLVASELARIRNSHAKKMARKKPSRGR